ncbi:phospholipid ABC transporter ATP-binding protein MlaF [Aliamphritea spongicola]|uniref:phospholipid ABC transporter ATP-binding protein MlaF n=1 Tax=Aliamphritea spongicola TaxID=707589 RepID=UPI00196B6757|nr:phospholipid ABC transporter ATP-binding protein MlaF [Aliamphritea spongicola]MBN3564470.1 phospholipid ABC transporter ATP-binding protein MlaF [Aliamphritea spongicola]
MSYLDDSIIDIKQLSFARGDRAIFDGVDIRIPRGKVTAVMGPSGTGKTTLLRLIGGQLKPDNGQILLDEDNIPALSRKELFRVREKMGMLFQSGALFTDMTVFENVAFPIRVHTDLSEQMIRDVVLMKLHAVGLRGAADMMPSEMSGGMARRVALARAIALDPDLVMYDEPFTGQDPIAMGVLVNLIARLNKALGHTSIIVSHDINETLAIADYIYLIADAKVLAHGTAAELRENDSPQVRQFLDGLPDGPVPFHFPADDYLDQLMQG